MRRSTIIIILISLSLVLFVSSGYGFRLFAPSSPYAAYSRASWEAAPNNMPFNPAGQLRLNINGTIVTVDFGVGGVSMTAEQVAAAIRAAIAAQAPGSATVTVVGTSLGTGTIKIVPTAGTITVLSGHANNANTDLLFNNWGNPPMTTLDPWDPPPFLHWDLREFTNCRIPYAVNPNAAHTTLGPADLIAEVQGAFQAWEDVLPAVIDFDLVQPSAWNPGQDYFRQDSWNVVSWGWLPDWTFPGPSGMTRWRWDNRTGALYESDIILNNGTRYRWVGTGMDWVHDLDAGPGRIVATDARGVTTHEIGHFLGLAHVPGPGNANDQTMSYGRDIWGLNWWSVPNLQLRSPEFDDRDGCNFLYTPDLGDAPDPVAAFNFYPSLVHGPIQWAKLNNIDLFQPALGADHFYGIRDSLDNLYRNGDYQYEWLGAHIDDAVEECEARVVNLDEYDDGTEFLFNWWGLLVGVRFQVSTNGRGPNRYASASGGWPIFVNGWLDLNNSKDWEDPAERLVDWQGGPGHGAWPAADRSRKITRYFTPVDWPVGAWFRIRLDWGEQVGRTRRIDHTLATRRGAAQLGEVEDYPRLASAPPFHGWHYGYDYFDNTWPYWDYPGVEWDPDVLTLSINTPWWWHCYEFPPPPDIFYFGIAVPQTLLEQGWWIDEVAFRKYKPGGGGALLALLTADETIAGTLNGDFPMGDGTIWFGYGLQEFDLPVPEMVLYFKLRAPDGWHGFESTKIHFIAGDTLFGWSPELYTDVPLQIGEYLCGDANNDVAVDISDAVYLIAYIFSGGSAPNPLEAGDANCDSAVDISDVVYLIAYIFSGGAAPCAGCPTGPTGVLLGMGECKQPQAARDANAIADLKRCVQWEYDGVGTLLLKHVNATFNCCPQIETQVTITENTITIQEIEIEGLCHCMCTYDLDFQISSLPAGEYTINVIEPYVASPPLQFTVDLVTTPTGEYCVTSK